MPISPLTQTRCPIYPQCGQVAVLFIAASPLLVLLPVLVYRAAFLIIALTVVAIMIVAHLGIREHAIIVAPSFRRIVTFHGGSSLSHAAHRCAALRTFAGVAEYADAHCVAAGAALEHIAHIEYCF